MKLDSLEALFVDNLKDLYDAEQQLIEALPKMAKAAHSPDLKRSFEQHLDVTKEHSRRLETIFSELNERPTGKKCVGMQGLIKEGEEVMTKKQADPDVVDAGMIAAAQKVEHYEISGYGTVRTYAETLGRQEFADLLDKTLDEESRTDEMLTRLAESHINVDAMR
ncbi:MAG: ferritin-like domain-containing protein [Chloroflexota bacterium]|nr:MAG: ferritin-like domain-containing protein [Chloroflexota bacterium]